MDKTVSRGFRLYIFRINIGNETRIRVLTDELNDRNLAVSLPVLRSYRAPHYPYFVAFLRISCNSHLLLFHLYRECTKINQLEDRFK